MNPQFLALFAILSALAALPAHAADYVIITDPSIVSPEAALDSFLAQQPPAVAGRGTNALRSHARAKPRFRRKVNISEHHDFGLVEDVEEEDLASLQRVQGVLFVVPNINISHAAAAATRAPEKTTQWNLDRIDQSMGRDGLYIPSAEDGEGTDLYIIDSGVNNHKAFGNRLQPGFSAVYDDATGINDCNGHGTHVASTAAGDGYGVARGARIFPVQILNCGGQGSLMGMASGVSWVIANMKKMNSAKRTVVNLSIQATANSGIDELVRQLHAAGAVVVVAAANFNTNACNYSPAREPLAVTVGATSQDDSKLPSSNFGQCVNIFAPGDDIIGASYFDANGSLEKQGTSMASPLVAGVLATLRQKYPQYTNTQIIAQLYSMGTKLTDKPVMDLDCGGQVPSVTLLQALSASQPRPSSITLQGSTLRNDFMTWAPELTTQALNGELCLAFSVKIDKVYNAAKSNEQMANLRLMLSTDILPLGLTNFLTTSLSCRSLDPRFYVIENGPDGASVSNFQSKLVGNRVQHSVVPSQEMSTSVSTDFYLVMRAADDGTTISFGRGDGESERTRDEILSVKDVTSKLPTGLFKYLSLSTANAQDLVVSNIRSCNGAVPSSPPGGPSSGGDIPTPVTQLEITKMQVNAFNLWPSLWTKKENTASCLAFSANMQVKGNFMVAMTNQPLGVVPTASFVGMPADAALYEFQVSRTHTKLIRNGEMLVNAKHKLKIGNAAKWLKFRTSLNNGLIRVELFRNNKWRVLFSYAKDKAALTTGAGKRMALASAQPRTFTNIEVC